MRRLGAGKLAALLGSLLAVTVVPAQAQTYKPESMMQGRLWDPIFGGSPKAESKEPINATVSVPTVTDRVMQHERLRQAYLRRAKVCLRLREIALETNNTQLDEEALRLDEMAFAIYMKQCKQLGLGNGDVPGTSATREDER